MELADSSNDSMLGVKDLETKVVSTSLGIELHVWCPVKWDEIESDGDLDETQPIVVGLIKDVSNLRTEGGSKANADGEPSIFYEVALFFMKSSVLITPPGWMWRGIKSFWWTARNCGHAHKRV